MSQEPPALVTPSPLPGWGSEEERCSDRYQSVEWDGGLLLVTGAYGLDGTGALECECSLAWHVPSYGLEGFMSSQSRSTHGHTHERHHHLFVRLAGTPLQVEHLTLPSKSADSGSRKRGRRPAGGVSCRPWYCSGDVPTTHDLGLGFRAVLIQPSTLLAMGGGPQRSTGVFVLDLVRRPHDPASQPASHACLAARPVLPSPSVLTESSSDWHYILRVCPRCFCL